MSEISSLRDTIVPKSDQLNAEDLLAGPITITVTGVQRSMSPEQPVALAYEGDNGRPYKPCKTMRKVLIFAWGDDGHAWVGRSMTLYNNPDVKWGGVKVGGVRISHLSDIERDIIISLAETKGKKAPVTIKRLTAVSQPPAAKPVETPSEPEHTPDDTDIIKCLETAASYGMDELREAWGGLDQQTRTRIGKGKLDELKAKAAQNGAAE